MDIGDRTFSQVVFEPGAGSGKVTDVYNTTHVTYDEYMLSHNYVAHIEAAKRAARVFKTRDVRILDVGAGTGLVGLELAKRGFTNLDAVDASAGMLEEAAKKKIYSRLICAFVNEVPLDVEPNTYDAAVTAGSMGDNHLPGAAFAEMVRVVKPGGYVIITVREAFLGRYKEELDDICEKLERDGKWKLESSEVYPKHYDEHNGVAMIYRVL